MKTILVCGSSGFIGGHLVKRLKAEGNFVIGADIQDPKYNQPSLFYPFDLRVHALVDRIFHENKIDEVYQLAADMGGAGYVFSGDNDADIMHNSALININIVHLATACKIKKIFYSSSACMYPKGLQRDANKMLMDDQDQYGPCWPASTKGYNQLKESDAYPADPDSEYGWEKLFSERLYLAYKRNYNLDVRIARFHNIYGPEGTYKGGREKAPAAICRKVIESEKEIEIWNDGNQTRSFLYIDDCIEAVRRLMESDFTGPVNIGSEEMVSINELAEMVMNIADKNMYIKHIPGPQGVRGRNSDNTLIFKKLQWKPKYTLLDGMIKTYLWIKEQHGL